MLRLKEMTAQEREEDRSVEQDHNIRLIFRDV